MKKVQHAYLLAGTFVAGMAVMTIEVAGTRMMAPWFGTGVYVWAALISVTLAALAVGYFVGGFLADRRPVLASLLFLFLGIGVTLVAPPFLGGPVMKVCASACGIVGGAFAAAACLFALPLVLLGMVAPVVLRIAARGVQTVGTTAGMLYGLSTAGSLAGTLLTALVLVPAFGCREIFIGMSGLLLLFAGIGWLIVSRKAGGGGVVVLGVLVPLLGLLPQGSVADRLYRCESLYGTVEVVEAQGERSLVINGNTHSHISRVPGSERMACEYVQAFARVSDFRPGARSGLCLGLGAGLVPQLLAPKGVTFTVVEIDPVIPEVAREYFGALQNGETLHIADGRNFVRATDACYDVIVVDPSSVDAVAYHMYSMEFFQEAAARLSDDGLLAMNAMGTADGGQLESIQLTLEQVFRHVRAFRAHTSGTHENAVFFASNEPLRLPAGVEAMHRRNEVRYTGEGIVLTDNHNPIDVLSASLGPAAREARQRR